MSLNIKNERTHALVRELAELTGLSQTSAVEDAVRDELARVAEQGWALVDGELEPGLRSVCLLYTSPSPRDGLLSRMPSSA